MQQSPVTTHCSAPHGPAVPIQQLRADVLRMHKHVWPLLSAPEPTQAQQAEITSYYRRLRLLNAAYRQQAALRSESA